MDSTFTVGKIILAKRLLKAMNNDEPTIMPTPVYIPASLYDRAKAEGIDMTGYVRRD